MVCASYWAYFAAIASAESICGRSRCPRCASSRQRHQRDAAVDRADRHHDIDLLRAHGVGDLIGPNSRSRPWPDRRRTGSDNLWQVDVRLCAPDHSDAIAGQLAEFVIFAAFLPFGATAPTASRRSPERRDGLRVLRYIEVTEDDSEISLAFGERGGARDRASSARSRPRVAALARQRLHQSH